MGTSVTTVEITDDIQSILNVDAETEDPCDYFSVYTINLTGTQTTTYATGESTETEIDVYIITDEYGNVVPIQVLVDFDMTDKTDLKLYRYHDENDLGEISLNEDNVTQFTEIDALLTPTNNDCTRAQIVTFLYRYFS